MLDAVLHVEDKLGFGQLEIEIPLRFPPIHSSNRCCLYLKHNVWMKKACNPEQR